MEQPRRANNIYPILDRMLSRSAKAEVTGSLGFVIWLYGLSGSGKSTIATLLERKIHSRGVATCLLDGDNLRSGLTSDLGFGDDERRENIRRAAEVAKLMVQNGITTICAFITPRQELRDLAREIIGEDDFYDVFVDCSVSCCEARDVKGLYASANSGKLQQFTGKGSVFEAPESPGLHLDAEHLPIEESAERVFAAVLPRIAPSL